MSVTDLPLPELHATGTGAPVLLLHPLGVDRSFWSRVMPMLDSFEALMYDFPGHGETPAPDGPYTIEDLAKQAAELVRDSSRTRVDVVGVSLGGLVAQQLAACHGDVVRRLVVVDAVAVYPPALKDQWRERAVRARASGLEQFLTPTLDLWFTAEHLSRDGPDVELARRAFTAGSAEGYARACEALERVDLSPVLEQIEAPTLSVCGDDDAPPFRAHAEQLAETVPGAELAWLAPARHAGVLEQPERFVRALVPFLERGTR